MTASVPNSPEGLSQPKEQMVALPVVAKCQKCGREFVTHPRKYPAHDPYLDQCEWGQSHVSLRRELRSCGGLIIAAEVA
jgi:rRNA maturation protein Nop10